MTSLSEGSETFKELIKQRPRMPKHQVIAKNTKSNSNPCWNEHDVKKLEKCVAILGTDFDLI
jgi:hypothetical protein